MFKPRVGKVKTGHTTDGFTVIIPLKIVFGEKFVWKSSFRVYLGSAYLFCLNWNFFAESTVDKDKS